MTSISDIWIALKGPIVDLVKKMIEAYGGGGGHVRLHALDSTDDHDAPSDTTDLDATVDAHGLMSKADKIKLDGISEGASGDVTGPSVSVDQNIVLFSGTTGKVIQDSGVDMVAMSHQIGALFWMNSTDSLISGYKTLAREYVDAPTTKTINLSSGDGLVLVEQFITDEWSIPFIPDGIAENFCYFQVSAGIVLFTFDLYKYVGGALTKFTSGVQSGGMSSGAIRSVGIRREIEPSLAGRCNLTDRVVLKVFVNVSSPTPVDVTLYYGGPTYPSYMRVPVAANPADPAAGDFYGDAAGVDGHLIQFDGDGYHAQDAGVSVAQLRMQARKAAMIYGS